MKIVDFVEGLELPETPPHLQAMVEGAAPPTAVPDDKKSALVTGGSLISFVSGLSDVNRADVMNSTLLAQLAATKKYPDKVGQAKQWFDFYSEVLTNVGWNMPAWSNKDLSKSSGTLELDTVALELAATIMTASEVAIIKATMDALKATATDSKQMTVWDTNASSSKGGQFQTLPCSQSAEGVVVMALSAMQYKVTESHSRFLWWSWSSSSIKVEGGAAKVELNDAVYSQVRASIVAKLGDKAVSFVASLEI